MNPANPTPLVQVQALVKHFPLPGGWLIGQRRIVHALDGVDVEIHPGKVFGLVGESGCGKTTLGRCALHLIKPTSGAIIFDGQDLSLLTHPQLRRLRARMQIVFQNPLSSLSPRLTIGRVIEEPLQTHGIPKTEWPGRVLSLLEQVGLGPQHLDRYPHELSGGQCQRVSVARALSLEPSLLVLDEPTSALDVSVQAQIINLLDELRHRHSLTYLFISHDLGVVEYLSDRIGVMYLGKMVETGPTAQIFNNAQHPYTRALLDAMPQITPGVTRERQPLEGNIPSPLDPPPGCRFHTRCPVPEPVCRQQEPLLREVAAGHWAACHVIE